MNGHQCDPSSSSKEKNASSGSLKGSDGENLADLAFVEGKRVRWSLKLGDDNEFYLHLKDIEYADTSERDSLSAFLLPKAGRTSELFDFFGLPPELQLQILQELSSRDLNSCRLTCRWMNKFIVSNWCSLRSREIGCIDFIPDCQEVWGLYYDYAKPLSCFQNSRISRLVMYYGIISSSLLTSLSNLFSSLRISVKALIIHNCRCDCNVSEFVHFVKCTNVEMLAIDVFEMRDLAKAIVGQEAILNLNCALIYANGDDVISGIVVNSFYEGSVELGGFSRLLTDWGRGCMDVLHFHMTIDGGVEDASSIWQDSENFSCLRGCVLRNCDNQELFVKARNGRLVLTPVDLSEEREAS